ncbi:hypothetical protein Lal_00009907 [Lupinus albus]|uniref:mitogen-activated protein kinase kinase kinase n=1 Tax=Lupinus albus TaxID=3870 RepID=A0A6A5LHX9_LUPAL|nr:putative mitogen-activated protein kinase kinase kinase STE-STE11 family [Lupinus albus]KAF1859323.1 hypothetical protein Lal_00009907 [Lupinus albus]
MEWSRGHIIGHGSSATVYLAASHHSTTTTTITAVKSSELSHSEHLQKEQKIMSSLSSPYIVTYKGYDITTEYKTLYYNLFMEYMPYGTLFQATRRGRHGRINEPLIALYTTQIVHGLEYLHSKGLVHCDIKGSNILANEDGAKISDFGCAKYVNDNEVAVVMSGTPMFMSPEVARGEEQGYPCDIWALGCTIVEIATGFAPWPNVQDPVSILYHVAYSNEVPEIPSFLSHQAKDFLGKCFMRNPKERWSASQLLKHPFLVEISFKGKQIMESNSCSPTSILDQGFWNSVEESECQLGNNLVQTSLENSVAGRIKWLALCSTDPNWTWDDENWITTIGNNNEIVAQV